LLLLGVGNLQGGLIEEEPTGIVKPLDSSRRSRSIRSGESKLHPLEALLDNSEGILKLGEEEAKYSCSRMREVAKASLDLR
jgi:hypothetical protein